MNTIFSARITTVSIRLSLGLSFFLFLSLNSISQSTVTATSTAMVSADIVESIGQANSGNIIGGTFKAEAVQTTIEIQSNPQDVNETKEVNADHPTLSSFTVTGDPHSYSITVQFNSLVINQDTGETMRIESLNILPANDKEVGDEKTRKLLINASVNVGASQQPGNYFSQSASAVTVHFN